MKKFYILSSVLILIDRVVKILVQNFLTSNELFIIKNFFYITYVKNIGAAFSIFEGMQLIFILLGIIVSSYILYYVKKYSINNIGYAMLLSGVIGNIIDRIVFGYVIDYLGFIIFNRYMPIFNLADSLIVVGAILIFIKGDVIKNGKRTVD